jgi:hypothetical protein
MAVCLCVSAVLYVQVAALRRTDHSSKQSYHLYKNYYRTEEEGRAQQRAVEPLMNEWMYANWDEPFVSIIMGVFLMKSDSRFS